MCVNSTGDRADLADDDLRCGGFAYDGRADCSEWTQAVRSVASRWMRVRVCCECSASGHARLNATASVRVRLERTESRMSSGRARQGKLSRDMDWFEGRGGAAAEWRRCGDGAAGSGSKSGRTW